jgi:hypothetical protein
MLAARGRLMEQRSGGSMAYVIRQGERAAEEVRRILLEQNARALAALQELAQDPAAHVHSARQCFKRLRALLRLIRSAAPYVYSVENRHYRDIARTLSVFRDSSAVIDALGVVMARTSDPLIEESVRMLRASLEARVATPVSAADTDVSQRVASACEALRNARRRLRDAPLSRVSRKRLRAAAASSLARVGKRFVQVLHSDLPADFHAWRKDVKYAYHQTRLMRELMPQWTATYGPPLEELGEILGHCQDLAVLDALLRVQPDALGLDMHLQRVRRVVRAAEDALREQARQLGRRTLLATLPVPDNVVAFTPGESGNPTDITA